MECSILYKYKVKLKEATRMLSEMSYSEKQDALIVWNDIAEEIQNVLGQKTFKNAKTSEHLKRNGSATFLENVERKEVDCPQSTNFCGNQSETSIAQQVGQIEPYEQLVSNHAQHAIFQETFAQAQDNNLMINQQEYFGFPIETKKISLTPSQHSSSSDNTIGFITSTHEVDYHMVDNYTFTCSSQPLPHLEINPNEGEESDLGGFIVTTPQDEQKYNPNIQFNDPIYRDVEESTPYQMLLDCHKSDSPTSNVPIAPYPSVEQIHFKSEYPPLIDEPSPEEAQAPCQADPIPDHKPLQELQSNYAGQFQAHCSNVLTLEAEKQEGDFTCQQYMEPVPYIRDDREIKYRYSGDNRMQTMDVPSNVVHQINSQVHFEHLLPKKSPHTCETCGKTGFSSKGNLKRHQLSHTGHKPFKCDHCDSCFTEKKSLKIHVRRHTGEKPYKCDVCEKLFSQACVLQAHKTLHLNERKHECAQCGKAFRQRSQLNLHIMRHEGLKRLECQSCDAKFLTRGDLARHRRSHTGERPFTCNLCAKTFTRQQSLREHLARHRDNPKHVDIIQARDQKVQDCDVNLSLFEH